MVFQKICPGFKAKRQEEVIVRCSIAIRQYGIS